MSPNDPHRKPRKPKPAKKPVKPKSQPALRKNTKVTGERSEADFLSEAINRYFGMARPWGDSRRYDFILDNGFRLFRIQVKCTECICAGAYETRATYSVGKGRAVYTKKDIDFIAAHVVPLDIWYIIPVEVCTPRPMLRFYPHRKAKKMRLEPYREAWHLLQSEEENGKIEIQAVADETVYAGDAPVGTAAPGCPPSPARSVQPGSDPHDSAACGSDAPVRQLPRADEPPSPSLKPVHLPKSAGPWPIPPLRILATRKGKRILPTPPTD